MPRCEICGMALEPMLPSDEPGEELTDFTRRMWISAAAAVPLVVLTMGEAARRRSAALPCQP